MKKISGIEHLHGNFYKVPFSSILTPDKIEDSTEFSFSNPRLLTQKGINTLTDKKASSDLRDDIKKRTLLTALICRWVDSGNGEMAPQLVGGDRRYRALDYLIKKKEEVADPRCQDLSKKTTADIAYEYIVCQVFSCDNDLDAAVLSWAENKNRVDLTEGHEVAAVLELRKFQVSDDKIMEVLQRDCKWLKETDDLIECLDEETLSLLCEDKIKRGAAAHISKIDPEHRSSVLKAAIEKSEEVHAQRMESFDKQLNAISKKKDRAETKKVIAEDSGDEKLLQRSQKVLDRSEERKKDISEKRSRAKPIASKKMVEAACKEVGVEVGDQKKAGKKIIRGVLSQIQSIIDQEGEVALQDESFFLDVTFLELIKMVLNKHALNDSSDFIETLAEWRGLFPEEDSVAVEDEAEVENEDDEEDEDESEDDSEDGEEEAEGYTEDNYPEDSDFYTEESDDD